MNKKFLKKVPVLFFALMLVMVSCKSNRQQPGPAPSVEEAEILLAYLEENGDLLNGPAIPALMNADAVYALLVANNIHVIDLRPAEEYAEGHITHSVNVTPPDILDHFENRIHPAGFDHIVLACSNGQLSGYVNAVLLFLGYDNVVALQYGLSSWDEEIAQDFWLAATSDHLEGQLETVPHSKNSRGELPALATGHRDGYHILRTRAREVLNVDNESFGVSLQDVTKDPERFYLINYWPEDLYNRGHLPGAVQYTPKVAFHSSQYITTLPVDQPIVTYCFTGHHSSYATAFLRLLGYDAYNFNYGANSFIHQTMLTTQPAARSFTQETIRNFPLTGRDTSDRGDIIPARPEESPTPVIGGC